MEKQRKDNRIAIRVSDREYERIKLCAKERGIKVSRFIRETLFYEAARMEALKNYDQFK